MRSKVPLLTKWVMKLDKLRISGTKLFNMVCVALQEPTDFRNAAVITSKKLLCYQDGPQYLTPDKQYKHTQTHTHTHARTHARASTHKSWWLVLGWVTTKEGHPRLPIASTSYTYVLLTPVLQYNYTQSSLILLVLGTITIEPSRVTEENRWRSIYLRP